jgi:conjugal transfer mating pair stabilization protein TraG
MTLDVVTFGGGENYRDVFIAVALMTGTGAMASLIRVGLLLGLIWGMLRMLGDLNPGRVLKWFIACALIYGCVFVPKVDVKIVDRFEPALPGALVANVPLGVAFAESLASQVGARMIDMTETAFGDPADVEYSQTGMIYGAKFMEAATRVRFQDATYEQNLDAFFKNCVWYDLNDNHYTIDQLAKANDIWAFLAANAPNPARSTPYVSGAGPDNATIRTCPDAFSLLADQRGSQGDQALKAMNRRLNPGMADGDLVSKGYGVFGTLIGLTHAASTDAQASLVQIATLNALQSSLASSSSASGASNALAQAQADLQTHNAGSLLAHVGENSIVALKIVIDLLFVGMFPILFPMFLLPHIGPKMLQGYGVGFFYLQLWGPMYVIVHKVIMTAAEAQTGAAAALPANPDGPGFNLMTLAGVNTVNANIQTVAGMMILMIPVIAGALTKGAMAVGGQGDALLQPFRSGAESAAAAQTSGNWSYGSTSVDTHAFNNVSGNRIQTSGYVDTGFLTARNDNYDEFTLNPQGQLVSGRVSPHDTAASFDRISERAAQQSERARSAHERVSAFETVAAHVQAEQTQRIHEAAFAHATGSDDRTAAGAGRTDSQGSSLSWITSIRDEAVDRFHVDKGWAARVSALEAMSIQDAFGIQTGGAVGRPVSIGADHRSAVMNAETHQDEEARNANEQRALDLISSRMQSADFKKTLDRSNTQSINRNFADYVARSQTISDKAAHAFSNTKSFTTSRRSAETESLSLEHASERLSRAAETVKQDHGASFFAFATDYLAKDPYGYARSPQVIMDALQGRGDRRLLDDAVDAYAARFLPDLETPAPIKDAERALSEHTLDGSHPSGEGAAMTRHAHGHSTPATSNPHTAPERASQAGIALPDDDREIRPTGALDEVQRRLAGEVSQGLSRPLPKGPLK